MTVPADAGGEEASSGAARGVFFDGAGDAPVVGEGDGLPGGVVEGGGLGVGGVGLEKAPVESKGWIWRECDCAAARSGAKRRVARRSLRRMESLSWWLGEILLPTLRDETAKDGAPGLSCCFEQHVCDALKVSNEKLRRQIPPLPVRHASLAQGPGGMTSFHCLLGTTGPLLLGGSVGLNLRARSGVDDDVGGGRILGFLHFDAEDVAGAEHIAGEEDERFVGREADVGLLAIVVVGHVDEAFGFEDAGLPEVGSLSAPSPMGSMCG